MKKLSIIFGCVGFLVGFSAFADVVRLNNGDQISGNIIKMGAKNVTVETKYAGEIILKWEDIATLQTDSSVTFMLPDRSRIKGKITSVENGQLKLEGGTPDAVNVADIAKINPVASGEYETTGHFQFGGFRSQGNSEKYAIHTSGEILSRDEWNRFTLGAMYNLGADNGKESENNLRVYGKYDRFIDDHWYGYLNTDFTKDRFQNLDYRIHGGAGLGYQFWDDDIKHLSLEAGPGYTYEVFRTGEERNYATARWALRFHYWILEDRLQLFHNHEGLISVEDIEDTLVRTQTGIRVPVYEGFNLLAQFNYDYKNKPAAGAEQADYRYILGVGYLF